MFILPSRKALMLSSKKSNLLSPTSSLLLEMCPCGLSQVVGEYPSGEEASFVLIGTPLGLMCYPRIIQHISFETGPSEPQLCEICGELAVFLEVARKESLRGLSS